MPTRVDLMSIMMAYTDFERPLPRRREVRKRLKFSSVSRIWQDVESPPRRKSCDWGRPLVSHGEQLQEEMENKLVNRRCDQGIKEI
jgi:hypothetical protein